MTISPDTIAAPDGRSVRLGDVAWVQAHEPDAARRASLEAERCRAVADSLAPLAGEILAVRHAAARELGWPSYTAMYGELGGLDLPGLRGQAQRFLEDTDEVYERVITEAAATLLGLDATALGRGDLPPLLRRPALDAHFPPGGLAGALRDTLGGFGVDLDSEPGIVLDLAPRPAKSSRAFCAPVRVPREIYLVLAPTGGWDDYAALLHEAGHAAHFAAADATLPFELRRLSDPAIGEAFAFLLEGIADEPAWLRARGADGPHANGRVRRLVLLRRYAAKLDFELDLHAGELDPAEAADRYAAGLSRALRVRWPREPWLTDLDPGLYAAHYLRAWALAAQLREALGDGWFASADAGRRLRAWWRDSHGRRAEEVLGAPLDFAALAGSV
jgi:hypothetical protein